MLQRRQDAASDPRFSSVVALFAAAIAALMVSGIKPAVVSAYITVLRLSPKQAGYLISIEMTGAMVGTLASGILLKRWPARNIVQGTLSLLLLAHLVSLWAGGWELVLVRLVAGLAAGAAIGVAVATMSRMSSPDRVFGAYTVSTLLLYAAAFAVVPLLLRAFGRGGLFGFMAAGVAIALSLSFLFPNLAVPSTGGVSYAAARNANSRFRTALVLCGTLLFYGSFGGFWAFAVEIGRHTTLSAVQVGEVMSLSQVLGAAAALMPVLLARRAGRFVPLCIALLVAIAGVALLGTSPGRSAFFAIAVPGTMAGLMLLFPYLMGIASELDPTGRVSTFCIALQSIGLAAGPAWAGRLVQAHGFGPLLWVTAAGFCAALPCLLPVAWGQDIWRRGAILTEDGPANSPELATKAGV